MEEAHFLAEDFAVHASMESADGLSGIGDGADDEGLEGFGEVVGMFEAVAEFHENEHDADAQEKSGAVGGGRIFDAAINGGRLGLHGLGFPGDASGGEELILDFLDACGVAFLGVFGVGDVLAEGGDGLGLVAQVAGDFFLVGDVLVEGVDLGIDRIELRLVVLHFFVAVDGLGGFISDPGGVEDFGAACGDLGVEVLDLLRDGFAIALFGGGMVGRGEFVVLHDQLHALLHPILDLRIGVCVDAGFVILLGDILAIFEGVDLRLEVEAIVLELVDGLLGVGDDFTEDLAVFIGPGAAGIFEEGVELLLGVLDVFLGLGFEAADDLEVLIDVFVFGVFAEEEVGVDDGIDDGGGGLGIFMGHGDGDVFGAAGRGGDDKVVLEVTDLVGEIAEPVELFEADILGGALEDVGVFHEFGLGAEVFGVEGAGAFFAADGVLASGQDVDGAGGDVLGLDVLEDEDGGGDGDDGPEEEDDPPIALDGHAEVMGAARRVGGVAGAFHADVAGGAGVPLGQLLRFDAGNDGLRIHERLVARKVWERGTCAVIPDTVAGHG